MFDWQLLRNICKNGVASFKPNPILDDLTWHLGRALGILAEPLAFAR